MKRAAANAAPPTTPSPAVASGRAAFEVGVGVRVEVCDPVSELAEEDVVLVEVTLLVELRVGVASALLDGDETWAK